MILSFHDGELTRACMASARTDFHSPAECVSAAARLAPFGVLPLQEELKSALIDAACARFIETGGDPSMSGMVAS